MCSRDSEKNPTRNERTERDRERRTNKLQQPHTVDSSPGSRSIFMALEWRLPVLPTFPFNFPHLTVLPGRRAGIFYWSQITSFV